MFKNRLFVSLTLMGFIILLFVSFGFASSNSFLDGYRHGLEYKSNIVKSLDNFFVGLDTHGYNIDELIKVAKEIEKKYLYVIPEKVEWMRGVSEATEIPYEKILLFNCFDKLVSPTDECTSFLAQGTATRNGVTIVAKNRDLGADSYNAVELVEHRIPSEKLYRAAYITIPQVKETYKFIGVKSVGRWGFGQGMNEFQVSIVDNDGASMDELAYLKGLHDNDYIRLALERAKTAREAVDVIAALTEKYGQAWNGIIFTIGDPNEAWVMEVAGYRWVAKRYKNTIMAIANQFQITDDYDLSSPDLVSYAIKQGWVPEGTKKINFRIVYGAKNAYPGPNEKKVHKWPLYTSQIRQQRAMELLRSKLGDLTYQDFIRFQKDHYDEVPLEDGTIVNMHQVPYYSSDYKKIGQFVRAICHHDIRGKTVSSSVMISRPGMPNELGTMWTQLGQPCQSLYVPFYMGITNVPKEFSGADAGSKFYAIRDIAFGEYKKYEPVIREVFDPAQEESYALDKFVREEAFEALKAGRPDEAKRILTQFTEERIKEALRLANVVLSHMIDISVKKQSWHK